MSGGVFHYSTFQPLRARMDLKGNALLFTVSHLAGQVHAPTFHRP
jgi:hypothetical protein